MKGGESNKDRLPQGCGSLAAMDGNVLRVLI